MNIQNQYLKFFGTATKRITDFSIYGNIEQSNIT